MKIKLYIFLLLGQFFSAQEIYYNSNNSAYDQGTLKTNFLPLIPVIIVVFSGIFFMISYLEGKNRIEDYSTKKINSEIWISLFIVVAILIGAVYYLKNNEFNPLLIVIPAKIIVAFLVSDFAKRKNRNPLLWWFLGFFEYHSALIVLGISKGLLPIKKIANDFDSSYNEKITKLNEMLNEKLINQKQFNDKKKELETEHRKNGYILKQKEAIQQKNQLKSKLEIAYKDGLLTEKEYLLKLSELENKNKKTQNIDIPKRSIEEKIEDEKEKFRRLHSENLLTFDEMKEKFRQVEESYKKK